MSVNDCRTIFSEFKFDSSVAQTTRNMNEEWDEGNVNECTLQL